MISNIYRTTTTTTANNTKKEQTKRYNANKHTTKTYKSKLNNLVKTNWSSF